MNGEQKMQIREMREKLCSYAEIAEATGLSVNTVKSYCYRNGLNKTELSKDLQLCKNCNNAIALKSKTKPRKFCSDACKLAWWKKHKGKQKSRFMSTLKCPTCGKKFTAYKSAKRKYCSENCYQRRNANEKA